MAINQTSFDKDFSIESKFTKVIKAILGNYFITKDEIKDLQQGTDFLIYTIKNFKIAVRLRRYHYYDKYRNQFTIRWSRPTGIQTEIDKIRDGLVDFMLYGWIDSYEKKIVQYFISDLNVFREHEPTPEGIYPNNPYDSDLAAYNIDDLPESFILKFWQAQAM